MVLALFSKLRTALRFKLIVKKYHQGGNQATPKIERWKLLHNCCDVEVVGAKAQYPSPSRSIRSLHGFYLCCVQDTPNHPGKINKTRDPLVEESKGQLIHDCATCHGRGSPSAPRMREGKGAESGTVFKEEVPLSPAEKRMRTFNSMTGE